MDDAIAADEEYRDDAYSIFSRFNTEMMELRNRLTEVTANSRFHESEVESFCYFRSDDIYQEFHRQLTELVDQRRSSVTRTSTHREEGHERNLMDSTPHMDSPDTGSVV